VDIGREKVKTILFITLSNLGDVMLTTPVFQKLCETFPGAVIDVSVGPAGRWIFDGHQAVREIYVYERHRSFSNRLRHLKEIRRRNYDLVIDLKNTFIPFLAGSRFRASFSARIKDTFFRKSLHKRDEHLLKLEALGINAGSKKFFIPITPEDKRTIDGFITDTGSGKTVLMNPGSKSHLKRWDAKKYAVLSDMLVKELGCRIFIAGREDDDRETVDRVLSFVSEPVTDICGKLSASVLAEFMRRSDLVITNDSAPLHIASAVDAPTIAVFGPSDERKYGPLSRKGRVVSPDITCRPCEKALCSIGPEEGCISRINVEEVFNTAKELLGG